MSGVLKNHLEEVDKSAEEMFEQLAVQMEAQEGITEALKANDQLTWVQQMNNIRNRVSEIVYKELIYVLSNRNEFWFSVRVNTDKCCMG
jgi:hypothetical protein